MSNGLWFEYEPGSQTPRQAFRASVPGLAARDTASGAVYQVQDISAGGVSLADPAQKLKTGDTLKLDILIKEHVYITDLAATVARHGGHTAGLRFTGPDRRQEERLDKLVLEAQKHLISKKKSGGSHIDEEHKT